MKVLVAGDRGYIGTVLLPHFSDRGHDVTGLDSGLYEGCDLGTGPEPPTSTARDIRDVTAAELAGYDAVVCLAALSNDPLGHLNPEVTYSINLHGTVHLATMAKAAGVERFVFASSCSLYGAAGSGAVAEDADMAPVTPYGESKALAEKALSALADDTFSPTYMRNATAYGASPRLRLDIVVNNLAAAAVATGEVRLQSDGTPWRPLVHVEDISRAALAALEAPRELVHDEAFNVGRDEDNLQVGRIAELVAEAVPGARVTLAPGAGPDLRDYRVDFSKLNAVFPDLNLGWSVAAGIDELVAAYARYGMTLEDFESSRYTRLRRIEELMGAGLIDKELRRLTARQPGGPGGECLMSLPTCRLCGETLTRTFVDLGMSPPCETYPDGRPDRRGGDVLSAARPSLRALPARPAPRLHRG